MNTETASIAEAGGPEYFFLRNESQRQVISRRAVDMVRVARNMDTVIFLDMGARPLAWLFADLWPDIYPNRAMPQIKFLNIGQEKAFIHNRYVTDVMGQGLPSATVQRLVLQGAKFRYIRTKEDIAKIYSGGEEVERLDQLLRADKQERRLIVDDIKVTSGTLRITRRILKALNYFRHHYSSFALIRDQDKRAFYDDFASELTCTPCLPWFGSVGFKTFDADSFDGRRRFVTPQDLDADINEDGLKLREEIRALSTEIRSGLSLPRKKK